MTFVVRKPVCRVREIVVDITTEIGQWRYAQTVATQPRVLLQTIYPEKKKLFTFSESEKKISYFNTEELQSTLKKENEKKMQEFNNRERSRKPN